jgi:hypothetical protein
MTNLNILRPSVGFRLNAYRRQPVNEVKQHWMWLVLRRVTTAAQLSLKNVEENSFLAWSGSRVSKWLPSSGITQSCTQPVRRDSTLTIYSCKSQCVYVL